MEPAKYNYDKGQDILVLLFSSGKPLKSGEIVRNIDFSESSKKKPTESKEKHADMNVDATDTKEEQDDNEKKSGGSVAHSTINSVLMRLQEEGFITWKKYGSVELTEKGREYASHFTNHHLIIERFLKETLDFGGEKAHTDAVAISRVTSCELIHAICDKMGISHEEISPEYCAYRNAECD